MCSLLSFSSAQAYSDLPFRFALAVPPVLKLAGQTQSILSNFTCIVAAAYKVRDLWSQDENKELEKEERR